MLPQVEPFVPLLVLFAIAVGMCGLIWVLATALGPRHPTPEKEKPFECGSEPIGNARERFSVKFYMVALLFIIFDVEAVFIYPWAIQLNALGWTAFWMMAAFVATVL